MTRDEKWMAHWGQVRTRGKGKYVLNRGVLGWGFCMAIVMTILDLLFHRPVQARDVWLNFLLFPAVGVLYGLGMWTMQEWFYAKKIRAHEQAA